MTHESTPEYKLIKSLSSSFIFKLNVCFFEMEETNLLNESGEGDPKKDDSKPCLEDRPPKGPRQKSTWSYYPGGGRTFFGSFHRVRVEGRRGRSYWEWKAAEQLKNLGIYKDKPVEEGDSQESYESSSSRSKGHVTFAEPETTEHDAFDSSSGARLKPRASGAVRVMLPLDRQTNEDGQEEISSPVERVTIKSFSQPRLTPLLNRAKPPEEPPAPRSGTIPSAPPKEMVYADAAKRRAERSQLVLGHEHQSLDCQESSKYPSDNSSFDHGPAVSQGLTKAEVYSDGRDNYLRAQFYDKIYKDRENQSKQSTYTDHSESSLNSTHHDDNTLSSLTSLSSQKVEFEPDTKPLIKDKYPPLPSKPVLEKSTSVQLRQKPAGNQKKSGLPNDARKSGALVWVSQPGGGAKLEWIPTPGLATLRAVPASPNFSNVKGRIASQSELQRVGVASSTVPPKGIIKRGDEGGGGSGGESQKARAEDEARATSCDPRVGASGGAAPSSPLSNVQSKNVLSSAPGDTRPAGRTVSAPTGEAQNSAEDKIVTVAGRGQGHTVRIRVRPEVHAYLSTLPVISASIRGSEPPYGTTERRDSIHSANSSSGSGLTLGSGEGSIGYQEQDYQEVVDEYLLLKKAVDEHDPEAIRLLTAAEAAYHPGTNRMTNHFNYRVD